MAITRRDPVKRLNVGLLLIAFVLSLFAGRLVQLQGIQSAAYAHKALKQRLDILTLPAVRGAITDAQGFPFAMTVEAREVFADPAIIVPAQRPQIAQMLAPMLSMDQAKLLQLLAKPGQFSVLAHNVTPDRARMVMALGYTGISTIPEYRRVYPNDTLAANVIGFVNHSGAGGAGLESSLNKLLAGRSGKQTVEIGTNGQRIPMGEDQTIHPVPGRDVRLTLLRDLQYKAQTAITTQVAKTGAASGSVIVMDPRTGQILAMASAPTFDPNSPGNSQQAWQNRAVQETFEPGSTNKVITAAAVMEHGGVTPSTPFTVPYSIRKYDQPLHDAEFHKTYKLTFGGVLALSSNVGTMIASDRITGQQLYQTMRDFGYGQHSGAGLPGESAGLLAPPGQWSGTQRYTIAYGQGVSVTALQEASVYATIANKGVRVAPTIVAGTTDGHGNFVPAPEPKQRQVISAQTAEQITTMLEGVVSPEGTAPQAQIPPYRVAGKTGTAQKVNPSCHCYTGNDYTASFAGFAPADDPQLVVLVVLQNPVNGHYGGVVAAPVFRDVMSFALAARKIPPTGSTSPKIVIYAK
ncbi:MAG: Peptidoglycan glycosyltransferase [Actinomycetia bacterium]|nr:Peptidoglycan glycosyltransferase [Actinomycetes bacterium]